MASKSQLDLLVRVRYNNPLPPPPYPPKLLNIPSDPKRYARIGFTQDLANDTHLPMVADSEMGMPLDLSAFDSLWDGTNELLGAFQVLPSSQFRHWFTFDDADTIDPPPIDPRDLFMLEGVAGGAVGGAATAVNVAWLRKTEYIAPGRQPVPNNVAV